jgi:twitching motility protein PilT
MGRQGEGAVFRVIPTKIKSIQELGLPDILDRVTEHERGLVLVTGPTGSGKSTTLAAMVDLVNSRRKGHILTIEDPIEFVHQHKGCIVNQREVGPHTESFAVALRAALREDPDVILVGEMRDLETISLAVTAAETGHLVFGTLHTSSAAQTVDRIIDVFPPHQQAQIRAQLAESIQAIIAQSLIPLADGKGRVAALEIMTGTAAARNLIRDGKTFQIPSVIQTSSSEGMQSLDQSLRDLVKQRKITVEEATKRAQDKTTFLQTVQEFVTPQRPASETPKFGSLNGMQGLNFRR